MTKLERYKQKLAELEAKRNELMRQGKYMQMQRLSADIENVKKLIKQAESYEPKPIRELVAMDKIHESGIIPALIECHLAADYLAACAYNVNDIIEGLGFKAVSIIPELKELIRKSNSFASQLCSKSELLSDMLIDNETLINALHKKTIHYIDQRVSPKQNSNKK